jgi:hypothetical protein
VPLKLQYYHTRLATGDDAAWIRRRSRKACAERSGRRGSAAFPCGAIHHTHHIHHMTTARIADARTGARKTRRQARTFGPPETATTSRCPAPERITSREPRVSHSGGSTTHSVYRPPPAHICRQAASRKESRVRGFVTDSHCASRASASAQRLPVGSYVHSEGHLQPGFLGQSEDAVRTDLEDNLFPARESDRDGSNLWRCDPTADKQSGR